jgi:hypothetical protein
MGRKYIKLFFLFLLICLPSAWPALPVRAMQGPDITRFVSPVISHHGMSPFHTDGILDQLPSPDQQARTPRPTSTPVPIPPPPDPGSINLMLFFGVVVVLIILFGVWINRQRSDKKDEHQL